MLIDAIKPTNPVSYILVDLKGQKLIGSFYEQELQKVINSKKTSLPSNSKEGPENTTTKFRTNFDF